jgi:hypothetical protein
VPEADQVDSSRRTTPLDDISARELERGTASALVVPSEPGDGGHRFHNPNREVSKVQATAPRSPNDLVEDVGNQVREHATAASPWIEGLGRFGYAAKGVVYLIVGGLAVQAALGEGGQVTDQKGAISKIAEAPFGASLLVVMAIGLLGYALWQLVRAALDTEHKGTDGKGLLGRAVYAGVAVVYAGLAFSTLKLAMGTSSGQGSTEKAQGWTAWLMNQPLGEWLVGLVGAAVVVNGLYQFYRAFKSNLTEDLNLTDVGAEHRDWVTRIGRAGYAARGVAFVMIGGFLIGAAMHHNPSEAQGLDGTLATLASQPFGPYLLGLVALGLAAYGVFALVEARYRRMVMS